MNILQALLQGVASDPVDTGPDIPVTGPVLRGPPPERMEDSVPSWKTDEIIPRKGMFGVKGTLRDVLGAIGDSFLVQSGNKPIYGPRRQQEKVADALYGYGKSDEASRQAAERVLIQDPEMGYKIFEDLERQKIDRARYEASALAQSSLIQDRGYKMAGSLANVLDSPEVYTRGKAQLQRMKDTFGLDFDIPEEYDADALARIYNRGIDPYRRETLNDKDQDRVIKEKQLGINQQNADSSRIRANRPPAGRAAPNPTAASIAAPLLKKIENGGTLTKAQQEVLDRTGYGPDRGKGKTSTRRAPPPLPPGFGPVTKVTK